ncbi:MAG TPA: hypothetical protein VFC44_08400 [Candidatus Saccharimonadales bacterium]|nr:hypothetical protein [Candidatus Saccharimonadales bacterium]
MKVHRPSTTKPLTVEAKARPVWEAVAELGLKIPAKEWKNLPSDAARNHKHYLYGGTKEEG